MDCHQQFQLSIDAERNHDSSHRNSTYDGTPTTTNYAPLPPLMQPERTPTCYPPASMPPLEVPQMQSSQPGQNHFEGTVTPQAYQNAGHSTPTHSENNSSSFVSSGSSSGGVPPNFGYPHHHDGQVHNGHHNAHPIAHYHPTMPPPPPTYHPGYYQNYMWSQPPPVELISNINPTDVLSGRGGATNSHCKY